MATLENCPVCGNKTSSNAEQCPSCGEPLGEGWAEKLSTDKKVKKGREKKKKGRAFWVVVAIFLLPFFLLTFFSGEPESVREAPIKEKAELPTSKDPANGSLARETPKKDTIFTNTPERENPSKNSSGSESKEPKPHIQQAVVRKNNPSSQAKSRQNIFKWVASSRGASIYSKPSQTSLIIGKVLAGKEVHATALSGIWVEAVFESGANGWLMAGDLWRERDDGSPPYTIVRSDSLHPHKLSYDIGLDKKATESQLRGIAQELYKFSSGSKFDRVFIVYLLRDTSPASGAWATSHFNPNLDVRISGATIEPCLSGYHPHPLYVVCLLGLQARAGAGALRRRSG